MSTSIHSRCIRICMAQASGISGLWPPTICQRLVIKCICAIYCDFLQGIGLTPTLFFCAAVQSWVKLMLIFFLYSSLYVIAVVCLGKEMSPELCELLPWEQRRGKSCSSVSSLQVMNPYFYKILYECSRCVVNPVYKHNSSKSGRTSFPSYTAYS